MARGQLLTRSRSGWVANKDLTALSPEKAEETVTEKMRKDLKEAFHLAAENNPIDHYKDILKKFQDEMIAQEEAKREAAATPKKTKKGKAKAVEEDENMADVDEIEEKPKSKKRKAEDAVSVSTDNLWSALRIVLRHGLDTSATRFCQEAKDQA